MSNIYEQLTQLEIVEVKELAQKLLNGKYFCGYNKADEDAYRKLMNVKYRIPLETALELIGYDLMVVDLTKTIYIVRQQDVTGPKTNLGLATTKLVYMLKKFFLAEMKKIDTNSVAYYKWNELLNDFAPFMKKSNEKVQLIDSLWVLKEYGFVDVSAPKKDMKKHDADDEVVISIFPSITCICDMGSIQMIEEELNDLIASIKDAKNSDEDEDLDTED